MTTALPTRRDALARLLATENLSVESDGAAQTASFDLATRTLTLPIWDKANAHTYDLLVGHEVGHALFTPNDATGWTESAKRIGGEKGLGAALSFLNIVEDARIERMIQSRYAGLKPDFFHGYRNLWDMKIFGVSESEIPSAELPDRLNLHFKVGSFINVPFFNDEERTFVTRTKNATSWEEVVAIATDLFAYMKRQEEEKKQQQQPQSIKPSGKPGEGQPSAPVEGGESVEDESQDGDTSSEGASSNSDSVEPKEAKTTKSLESAKDQLTSEHRRRDRVIHAYLPTPKLENIVREYPRVLSDFYSLSRAANGEYDQWFSENKKTVNQMVKAFNLKKAAEASARVSIRKTGVLNSNLLHKYKTSEDIFLKSSITRDGKNHGMILVLDWSGSMGFTIRDTIKQLITLVSFCRQVGIPFEVYGFSDDPGLALKNIKEKNPSLGVFHDSFSNEAHSTMQSMQQVQPTGKVGIEMMRHTLINLFSTKMTRQEIEAMSKAIYNAFSISCPPSHYNLSGTPLNTSLLSIRAIAKEFRRKHRVEILNTIVLTDGEASDAYVDPHWSSKEAKMAKMGFEQSYMFRTIIHDQETGLVSKDRQLSTEFVVSLLRQSNGMKVISMNLETSRRMIASLIGANQDAKDTWTDEGFVETTKSYNRHGWDAAFSIKATIEEEDMEEILEKQAAKKSVITNANIRNAFIKEMTSRGQSRVLVNRLTDLISR